MSQLETTDQFSPAIASLIAATLSPLAERIDREGFYPQAFLRELGGLGGFGAEPSRPFALDLQRQIAVTASVGSQCGSSAFLVWCQSTCAWYLQNAPGETVRKRYLDRVARGELLAGTGMSNAVKHLSGIEKIRLDARRTETGYLVSGVLPWVSNVAPENLLIVAAAVEGGGYIMVAVEGSAEGLERHDCPDFSGMQGTSTFNVRFRNVAVDAGNVLAAPSQFAGFMQRIKPGFVLGQVGMALGVVEGSLKVIEESNVMLSHVNEFLDDGAAELEAELAALRNEVAALAAPAGAGQAAILPVLKVRARASELALRAAQSAVLHAGARGYLLRHPAQRLLREAVFVAIVTPALKHLRKEIADLERIESECPGGHAEAA